MVLDTDATDSTGLDDADSTSTTSPALDGTTTDPTSTTDAPQPFCDQTDCDDDDPCTVDTCDPDTETCLHDLSPGLACDDANACTTDDTCQPDGTCSGTGLCTVEHCGEINNDEVWGPDVIHLVTCPIHVRGPDSPTLTILDGARVEFAAVAGVSVGYTEPGALDIQGDTLGVVLTSAADMPLPGDWEGLRFGHNHLESVIAGATIEYGGILGFPSVLIDGDAFEPFDVVFSQATIRDGAGPGLEILFGRAVIEDCTIVDHVGDGVSILGATLGGPFANNVVSGNGGAAVRLPADEVVRLDPSSTYAGNGEPVVAEGFIVHPGTWQQLDVDYHLEDATILDGVGEELTTLTIDPGVTINLQQNIQAGEFGQGALHAVGTASDPIRFIGGELRLGTFESSTLDHVIVEGGQGVEVNGVYPEPAAVTISNSVIRDTTGPSALRLLQFAGVSLTDTVIEDNEGMGVDAYRRSTATFSGNMIVDNGGVAMHVHGDVPAVMDATNVIAGNGLDVVEVHDLGLSASSTWPALAVPYRVVDDVDFFVLTDEGGTLTLEAGVVLEFGAGASLQVGANNGPDHIWYGGLVFAGEPGNPVILRSLEPSPSAGDWQGLLFTPLTLPTVLDHCVIQHGGGAPSLGAVVVQDDDVTITNCTISDSASYGIYQDGATATLSGNTYTNNVDGDVFP